MKNIINKTIGTIFALAVLLIGANTSFAAAPTVTPIATTNITSTSSTLNASFNANGSIISGVVFKYGPDPLMSQTANGTLPGGASGTLSVNISSLTSNTTYYFQVILISSAGITNSSSDTFTTLAVAGGGGGNGGGGNGGGGNGGGGNGSGLPAGGWSAPTVTPALATNITSTSSTLNASFNTNGSTISGVIFHYGNDPQMTQVANGALPVTASGTLSVNVANLTASTTYFFQVTLVSNAGITNSASNSFTTLASGNGGGGNGGGGNGGGGNGGGGNGGGGNGGGGNGGGGNGVVIGNGGLAAGGITNGSISLASSSKIPTTFSTLNATNVTDKTATLNGTAYGNHYSLTAWIEFPCSSTLGQHYDDQTSFNAMNLSYTATNLTPNTTYCYQVVIKNVYGEIYKGNQITFTTLKGESVPAVTVKPSINNNNVTKPVKVPENNNLPNLPKENINNGTNNVVKPIVVEPTKPTVDNNSLGASAGQSNFPFSLLPSTFVGWFMLGVSTIAIVLLAKVFFLKS